jgi:spermidine/putrescine-binding protein
MNGRVSRRELLRRGMVMGGAATAVHFGVLPGMAQAQPALTGPVNWLSFGPYHIPKVMEGFKQKYNVTVTPIDFEDDSEGFLKVKQSRAQYDVSESDGFWPQIYYKNHLIEPLDMTQFSSTKTIASVFRKFKPWLTPDGHMLQFPGMWSVEPIVYRKGVVKPFTSAWDLWDPKFKGRIIQMDRPSEFIPAVAIWLGYKDPFNLTAQQLGEVRKKLLALKPSVKTFTASSADFCKAMAGGEGDVGFTTSPGNVLRIKTMGGADFAFLVPKEGTTAWVDGDMLIANARHRAAALKWIDYRGGPESQYQAALAIKFPTCNEEAVKMLKNTGHSDWVQAMGMNRFDLIENTVQLTPPADIAAWTKVWNEFKA